MSQKFDYKAFLLEKGEKVGLYAALGVMGLLTVFGLYKVFASGSPQKNAKDLETQAETKKNLIRDNKPTNPEDYFKQSDFPPPTPGVRVVALAQLDPNKFRPTIDFFEGRAHEDYRRRRPRFVFPTEYRVAVALAQVRSNVFKDEFKRIMVLKGGTPPGEMEPGMMDTRMAGGAYGRQSRGGGGEPPDAGGAGGMPDPNNPLNPDAGADKKAKPEYLTPGELQKATGVRLAKQVYPSRMVLVTASFPYRKQLEEVKSALHLSSLAAAAAETQFAGFSVMRQEVGPDGKFPEAWDEKKHKLDFEARFKLVLLLTLEEYEDDDPDLAPVMIDRLFMGRPRQFRDGQYPKVEGELKQLAQALKEIRDREQPPLPPAKTRFTTSENLDIFSPRAPYQEPGGEGPGGIPGGVPPTGMPPTGMPPSGRIPPTGMPPTEMPPGGEGFNYMQDWIPPEHCLLRFIDVTAEPGKTYAYKYQIRMFNPNYKLNKSQLVAESLNKDPFLRSTWIPVPQLVRVPGESFLYALDQTKVEPKLSDVRRLDKDQVALQLHRWVDQLSSDSRTTYPVGDWSIGERMLAFRGEYLPREAPTEVAVWATLQEKFLLAPNPKDKQKKKVPVTFLSEESLPLLVHFEGGRRLTYDKVTGVKDGKPEIARVDDEPPADVLFLTPEGKLVARNSDADARDAERKKRYEEWKERIKKIKEDEKGTKPDPKSGSNDPFKRDS